MDFSYEIINNNEIMITGTDDVLPEMVEVPDKIDGRWVTCFGKYAFYKVSGMRGIKIPKTVRTIYNETFYNCPDLKRIVIPDTITEVGHSVFEMCSNLSYARIGSGLVDVPAAAFSECTSLSEVVLPETIFLISWKAFFSCTSLCNITIPSCVTEIGDQAFARCSSLKSVTIPDGVETIGDGAFMFCSSLKELIFPKSVTKIGDSVVSACDSLKRAYIPAMNLSKRASDERIQLCVLFCSTYDMHEEESKTEYINAIRENTKPVVQEIIKRNDSSLLEPVFINDIISADDIDQFISYSSSKGDASTTAALLNYKSNISKIRDIDSIFDKEFDL